MANGPPQQRHFRAAQTWAPTDEDLLRGRAALQVELARPENIPLADYARRAHKSRTEVDKAIAARRLLALSATDGGRRIPTWQLNPTALRLTRAVLRTAHDADAWTIYQASTAEMDVLGFRSAVEAVSALTVDDVAVKVLARLGVRPRAV